MTYRVDYILAKIVSPVLCIFGGEEVQYENGRALTEQVFDRHWLVDSISVRDERIVLVMRENPPTDENIGEESFF